MPDLIFKNNLWSATSRIGFEDEICVDEKTIETV